MSFQTPADPQQTHYRHELLQAGLDMLDQGLTVIDGNLQIVAWNKAFLRLLDFPPEMAFVGATFESFIRFNAERGEYGPGDANEQVEERMVLARSFTPHYTERDRLGGRILAVRGEPLPHNGFVTLYTDITARAIAFTPEPAAPTEIPCNRGCGQQFCGDFAGCV